MSDIEDALDGTPSAPKKRGRPVGTAAKKAATKPSKAVVTKGPVKAAKGNGKAGPAVATRGRPAKAATAPAKAEPAAGRGRPKSVPADVEMTQPDDSIVLKAVRKLKGVEMASTFAHGLGVHRRVIRAQLKRLAQDKANGVGMKKTGPNWFVSNTAK